jgi:hypothetical protein
MSNIRKSHWAKCFSRTGRSSKCFLSSLKIQTEFCRIKELWIMNVFVRN